MNSDKVSRNQQQKEKLWRIYLKSNRSNLPPHIERKEPNM